MLITGLSLDASMGRVAHVGLTKEVWNTSTRHSIVTNQVWDAAQQWPTDSAAIVIERNKLIELALARAYYVVVHLSACEDKQHRLNLPCLFLEHR